MSIQRLHNDRLLLVESDPQDREAMRESFEGLGLDIREVDSIVEALARIEEEPPSLVLSELSLRDGSGFSLCRTIRSSSSRQDMPVVLVSRWASEGDRILAFECGADDVIAKPFVARELTHAVAPSDRSGWSWATLVEV